MRWIIMTVVALARKVVGKRDLRDVLSRETPSLNSQDSELIDLKQPSADRESRVTPSVGERGGRYEEILSELNRRAVTAPSKARAEIQVLLDDLGRDKRRRVAKATYALERLDQIIAQNGNGRRKSDVIAARISDQPASKEIPLPILPIQQDSSWLGPLIPEQLDVACINDILWRFLRPGGATPYIGEHHVGAQKIIRTVTGNFREEVVQQCFTWLVRNGVIAYASQTKNDRLCSLATLAGADPCAKDILRGAFRRKLEIVRA